tara:strand:- start:925 stop:1461 length:537 start_codon:yes stop_codon:yes gene_type:complete
MGGAREDTSGGSGDHRTSIKKNSMVKKNPLSKIVKGGGVVLNLIKNNPISDKTEQVNRDFFNTKVKAAGKSKYNNYEDYIKARGRGEVDAYGREVSNRGNDNNQTTSNTKMASGVATNTGTVIAPSNAEISQASSTTLSTDEISIANKKKGRTDTIMTTAGGLGESNNLNIKKKRLGA